jgi:hypothetical protein
MDLDEIKRPPERPVPSFRAAPSKDAEKAIPMDDDF